MQKKNLVPSKKQAPVKREEHNPLSLLRHEMNSLFDNFFSGYEIEPFMTGRFGAFSPSVDVKESGRELRVSAELPGMEEKDIEVSLNRDSLTIKGEKKEEKEDKGKDFYRMERSYGSFSRTIPLPAEVDQDKVKAEFKKGVLTVTIPKTAKAMKETRKISIKPQ